MNYSTKICTKLYVATRSITKTIITVHMYNTFVYYTYSKNNAYNIGYVVIYL